MRGAREVVVPERGHADFVAVSLCLRARLARGPDFVSARLPPLSQENELIPHKRRASAPHTSLRKPPLSYPPVSSFAPRSLTPSLPPRPPPWLRSFAPLFWQPCWPMPRHFRLDVTAIRHRPTPLRACRRQASESRLHALHNPPSPDLRMLARTSRFNGQLIDSGWMG